MNLLTLNVHYLTSFWTYTFSILYFLFKLLKCEIKSLFLKLYYPTSDLIWSHFWIFYLTCYKSKTKSLFLNLYYATSDVIWFYFWNCIIPLLNSYESHFWIFYLNYHKYETNAQLLYLCLFHFWNHIIPLLIFHSCLEGPNSAQASSRANTPSPLPKTTPQRSPGASAPSCSRPSWAAATPTSPRNTSRMRRNSCCTSWRS